MIPFNVRLNLETRVRKKQLCQGERGAPTTRVFEVDVDADMQTLRNFLSYILPKKVPRTDVKKEEEVRTAQESSDLEMEGRELKTAQSYLDVVTAREAKSTEVSSPILHTSVERSLLEQHKQ